MGAHTVLRFASVAAVVATCAQAKVMRDGSGKLPVLGWNNYNAWHTDFDENLVLEQAQAIKDRGLQGLGYNYINIDDNWQAWGRDGNGRLQPDRNRFPDGIDGLARKIHDMGFKFGIYGTAGTETCMGYPASLGHEEIDAETFASWGVDYLKYDNCNVPDESEDQYMDCIPDTWDTSLQNGNGSCFGQDPDWPPLAPEGYDWTTSKTAQRYRAMSDALDRQDRVILLSICNWGFADVYSWGNDTAISWRSAGDIQKDWGRIMVNLNMNSFKMNYVNFWGHNDADMLEVGNGLNPQQSRSHFALWAAMKSPLLISTDVVNMSEQDLGWISNPYLIAFNQDNEYGEAAKPYKWGTNPDWTFDPDHPAEFWAGPSKDGTLVVIFNSDGSDKHQETTFSEVPGLGGARRNVINVWTGQNVGCMDGYSVTVTAYDAEVILVQDEC